MITASLQTLSAVGIGGLLATTMDVTGILAASTIGLFSFFLLPMQRNQTKQGLFTHSLTYSLTHLLTYALTHLLPYLLTHLLTHLHTPSEYSNRINTLQSQLVTVVTNSFNNELESCNNKIKSAIGPYRYTLLTHVHTTHSLTHSLTYLLTYSHTLSSTFVNSENDKLKALTSKLNEYKKTVHGIKGKIS